ncbi:phosphatase PAP2 family protein [candidate division WWE3 bacterium CG_4_10_14_0_2_um_filter_42_8]|uniref:Phosphatase PAP2 family protein n=1 Tax=candidate division WWE3 bacterium CG_4_10_14_0_2_um_filter_42_8 TaxID=1975074 RepID=A0A2M7TF08_UNCKA|nr:MAG: phosphatase PAP2 family protein [candidate division WWE3 bacterium CG_4_10_14_0_2_um_filter_42_8]
MFTLLTGVTLNLLLKLIFRVPRPDISPLEIATIYSFPSGHAMNSTVFYGSVAFLLFHFTRHKKLAVVVTILASVLILLVGASRIYLGVHYPSDVLASYLVGLLWLLICILFERTVRFYRLFERYEKKPES